MHELSLCENLLQIIEQNIAGQPCRQVKTVYLEIGTLSCVDPQALSFCFNIVMQNSIAADAQLQIDTVLASGYCDRCQHQQRVSQRYAQCAVCGHAPLQVSGGDSLRITQLEIE